MSEGEKVYVLQCLLVCERALALTSYQRSQERVQLYRSYLERDRLPPITDELARVWTSLRALAGHGGNANSNNNNLDAAAGQRSRDQAVKRDENVVERSRPPPPPAPSTSSDKFCELCQVSFPSKFK